MSDASLPADRLPSPPVRAAQYVRMSTEQQRYSIRNQADVIAAYAALRGFTIVRTYADEGRSGLTIAGRPALRQLIADISAGAADFEAVLVYDVSRWGRFQDADEGAYYEFLCRQLGISVHYCAEQFENDGSVTATLMKAMKRIMAAEYSRELSVKCAQGMRRIAEGGFRVGGEAPFGYRRLLIGRHGEAKGVMGAGDRQSLLSDRTVLVYGPHEEVRTVRRIFRMYVEKGHSYKSIAQTLAREGIRTRTGRAWRSSAVGDTLMNEAYIGTNVYGRTSFTLGGRRVPNPPEQWLRVENAFKPIVSRALFEKAQAVRLARTRVMRTTDAELLAMLARVHAKHGRLSTTLIDEDSDTPLSDTYIRRFGSLAQAYAAINVSPTVDQAYRPGRAARHGLKRRLAQQVADRLRDAYGSTVAAPRAGMVEIDGALNLLVRVLRVQRRAGGPIWFLAIPTHVRVDLCLVAEADDSNESAAAMYLLDEPPPGVRLCQSRSMGKLPALAAAQIGGLDEVMTAVSQHLADVRRHRDGPAGSSGTGNPRHERT